MDINPNKTTNGGVPTFTPPENGVPTFTPPAPSFTPPVRTGGGAVCYYHPEEPAAARCAKCGKYICKDCFDSYGVSAGDYAGQALCYDCTRQMVADNVENLKTNKGKILVTFIFTLIGMVIGAIIGGSIAADAGNVGLGIFLGAMIGGCFWTFIRGWFSRIGGAVSEDFNIVSLLIGVFLGFIIESIIAIFRTIKKVIECIVYLKRTSGFIESDSRSLEQMADYMEYTVVRNRNKGVDIETLLAQNSELANNSIAQMAKTQTDEQIEAHMRSCVASINENGEIIRDFAA